ncbi:unnamed protein product [Dovyalis caffra]|uniref:Uncharacterized protein n=1 Tax=Dovyalis caffra TaxID=77055 RepID=A0AAV1SNX8_9ROSI|nr:unnamed protein product [Dovyalis caffra]
MTPESAVNTIDSMEVTRRSQKPPKLKLREKKGCLIDVTRNGILAIVAKIKSFTYCLVGEDREGDRGVEDTLAIEGINEADLEGVELSLNSIVGLSKPRTLKLYGRILGTRCGNVD